MISCIILSNSNTANVLIQYFESFSITLIGVLSSVSETFRCITVQKPDILFVEMEFLLQHKISISAMAQMCFVVALGKEEEGAFEALECRAFDYIKLPINYSRLAQTVDKYQSCVVRIGEQFQPVRQYEDVFFIRIEDKGIKEMMFHYSDIIYIEAMQNYVILHVESRQNFLSFNTMKDMEEHLPSNLFTRVHKSFIINDSKIRFIDGNVITFNTEGIQKVLVGNSYRKTFYEKREKKLIRSSKLKMKYKSAEIS